MWSVEINTILNNFQTNIYDVGCSWAYFHVLSVCWSPICYQQTKNFFCKFLFLIPLLLFFHSVPAHFLSFQLFTDKETISPAIELVQNATPSVDTFFFLSGLLVGYFTFLQLEKRRFNIVVYFVHRYIRYGILRCSLPHTELKQT